MFADARRLAQPIRPYVELLLDDPVPYDKVLRKVDRTLGAEFCNPRVNAFGNDLTVLGYADRSTQ